MSDIHVLNWSSLKRTPLCKDLMEVCKSGPHRLTVKSLSRGMNHLNSVYSVTSPMMLKNTQCADDEFIISSHSMHCTNYNL